jgi:hypothetical protein
MAKKKKKSKIDVFTRLLTKYTDSKGWHEVPGPDSGVGLDYWYRASDGSEAYVNVDQGWTKIILLPDEEVIFEGQMD